MLLKGNIAGTGPVCLLVLFGIFFFFFEGTGWVKVAMILTALFGINVEKTVVPHQGGWKGEEEVPQLLPCLSLTACVVSSSDRAPA